MIRWRVEFVGGSGKYFAGGQWIRKDDALVLVASADWDGGETDGEEETPEALACWDGCLPVAILPMTNVLYIQREVLPVSAAVRRRRRNKVIDATPRIVDAS